jgi:hypothetical protein
VSILSFPFVSVIALNKIFEVNKNSGDFLLTSKILFNAITETKGKLKIDTDWG